MNPSQPAAELDAIDDAMRHDAGLAAVFFENRTTGWAVGDRGVIWHTRDGGAKWTRQASGIRCTLNSVFFIDSRRGWAVGGENLPYANATRGVVLRTDDGGDTWSSVPGLALPLLTGVKFFDVNVGIAFGFGSDAQPSGAFVTRDGGVVWQPLAADATGQWLAGDFLGADAGAVAGSNGRLATLARQRIVESPLAPNSLRSFHEMRLVAPTGGWIVGDGGLVMTTSDLGRSWQSPPSEVPGNGAQEFDFHALAIHGPHVWIAGSPGTRVFHSADGGASWGVSATGQLAPIRAIAFSDAQHGWAVGELGSILATRDGGRTWQVQRAGGQRAALLAVFANATDVPLELIARHGAAESYITAVDLLHRSADKAPRDVPVTSFRAREAMLLAGAAAAESAWRFPLLAEDLSIAAPELLNALNRTNDGQGLNQIERHLVRQLRTWRPDVVVTHHSTNASGWGRGSAEPPVSKSSKGSSAAADSEPGHPAAALVEQLVMRSVEAAADASRFPELAAGCGLEPWQVKKVLGVLPPGVRGDVAVDVARFSPWLGETPSDWSAAASRLLDAEHAPVPDAIELKLLLRRSGEATEPNSLFGGIPLAYGSEARRPAPAPPTENIEDIRQMVARRRLLRELLERTEGNAFWVGQIATLTDGLDARSSGEMLFQLAEGYRSAGRLDLAADTYFLMARRSPDHPLVDRALMWLVQFYASDETAHRVAADLPTNMRRASAKHEAAAAPATAGNGSRVAAHASSDNGVQQAIAVAAGAPTVGLARDDRLRRAVQLAEYLKAAQPRLYTEPALRFAEVCAQRQLGYSNEAKRYFLTLKQLPDTNPWGRCAATEEWLATPGETPPPKALASCRRAAARPHLDGRLEEPLWEAAEVLRFRGEPGDASQSARGQVQLAYDNEFLYIAVSCPKVGSGEYQADNRPRSHDADLRLHDRVAVEIDIDRDYSTAFELTLDHRGWCHDACWGDANWNPSWYIASAGTETSWSIEAAIPIAELTTEPPAARHVWALSARRIIPRVGYEAWAGDPADSDSPERFGLISFD